VGYFAWELPEFPDAWTAYADYWVAYKLDFLGRGHLAVTTVGYDTNRSVAYDTAVHDSRQPAWLFVPMGEARVHGTGYLQNSVRERRLSVVDVRNNGKIPYFAEIDSR